MKPDDLSTFGVGSAVFFYGTLRTNESNHRLVFGKADRVSEGLFFGGKMYSLGPFPAVVLSNDPKDIVVGEVFRVTDPSLPNRLDILEGYPNFYNRQEVPVVLADGTTVSAWIYHLNGHALDEPEIQSGDWKNRG